MQTIESFLKKNKLNATGADVSVDEAGKILLQGHEKPVKLPKGYKTVFVDSAFLPKRLKSPVSDELGGTWLVSTATGAAVLKDRIKAVQKIVQEG